MKTFESIRQYSQETSAFQKRHKRFYTNCFLMPEEIARLIEKRKLRFSTPRGALLLLCDRTDYQNFYFYLAQEAPIPDLSVLYGGTRGNGKIFFDMVYSENRPCREPTPLAQMIGQRNIRRYKCYQRMGIRLAGLQPSDFPCSLCPGYRLRKDPPPYPQVHSLWETVLDEKSTPLPDLEQLKDLSERGELFWVENTASGQPCGAAAVHIQGKQGTLQHLAVLPKHRRHGLAESLCHMVIRKGISSELKVIKLWVDKENHPAIALYTKKGFMPEGMVCDQYFIERNI